MTAVADVTTLRRLARARERFLEGAGSPQQVRPEIQRSWVRSAESGVSPNQSELPEAPLRVDRSSLYQAAAPVLGDLAHHLTDTSTALLLADRDGVILGRWVAEKSLMRLMDTTHSAPGFTLSEETIGTNGLGSVIQERSPFAVIGPEHYADLFQEYSCYGAPIINPRSNRIEGVLTFVCRVKDSSPLMLPFVTATSAQIGEQLPAMGTSTDRRLLAEFRSATRKSRAPTILVTPNLVITNPRGAEFITEAGTEALWTLADQSVDPHNESVEPDDDARNISIRPLTNGEQRLGSLVRITEVGRPRTAPSDHPRDLLDELRTRLCAFDPVWDPILATAIAAFRQQVPLGLFGEPGVGKSTFAENLHHVLAPESPLTVLHAGLADVQGSRTWFSNAHEALQGAGTILIREINRLDAHDGQLLKTIIEGSPHMQDRRLICTVDGSAHEAATSPDVLDAIAVQHLVLPSLRERLGDLPVLLRSTPSQGGEASATFTADAMKTLCSYDWPGNLRQLNRFIQSMGLRPGTSPITAEELPDYVSTARGRSLSEIERLERRAIQLALARTGSNKSLAARELGISRATLYRKIRIYRLDE